MPGRSKSARACPTFALRCPGCRLSCVPYMKTKIVAALFAVAAMLTPACEQHKWSETNQLFKSHGDHAEQGHSHGHDKSGDHAKPEAHGEKAKH
jgi:hypothetical protein